MKNFSDLLATNLYLEVSVDNNLSRAGLHDHLTFYGNANVKIDGIEILPKYWHLVDSGVLTINEPFYCWYHRVSGQGWLLTPQ